MDHPLYAQQLELEEWMLSEGKRRFVAQVDKAKAGGREASTGYGISILRDTVEHVAAEVTRLIAEAMMGRAGNSYRAVPYIAEIDAEVTAVLALRAVLNAVSSPRAYQTVAVDWCVHRGRGHHASLP